MSQLLTQRPRLTVAVGLALALLLALTAAVVATSFVRSGHAVKAVKVVTDDAATAAATADWVDVPSMALTMSVPANTQALFLITFSAEAYCQYSNSCFVRALLNGNVLAPGQVSFGTPAESTNSMQWVSSPMPAGTYTIKIQYTILSNSSTFYLHTRTLSLLRSVV